MVAVSDGEEETQVPLEEPPEGTAVGTAGDAEPAAEATSVPAAPEEAEEEEEALVFAALHGDGACEVAHLSADRRRLLSIGSDGRMLSADVSGKQPLKVWAARVADKNGSLTSAAVSPDAGWLAFGQDIESGFGVWVCKLDTVKGSPDTSKMTMAGRYTLPARHLCWHPSAKYPLLGIGTDDGRVQVWSRDSRQKKDYAAANVGGVRCIAFDPRGELLAAAFDSGALVIFGLKDRTEKFRCKPWPKSLSGSERLLLAWRPDGEELALPGSVAVRLVRRGCYKDPAVSLEGVHRHATTVAAWSPSVGSGAGLALLATASADAVAVWSGQQLLRACRTDAAPFSLLWSRLGVGIGELPATSKLHLAIGSVSGAVGALSFKRPDEAPAPPSSQAKPEEVAASPPQASTTQQIDGLLSTQPSSLASQRLQSQESLLSAMSQVSLGPDSAETAVIEQKAFQPGATRFQRGTALSSQKAGPQKRRYLAWNEHGMLKHFVGEDPGRSLNKREAKRRGLKPLQGAICSLQVEYARERGGVRELKVPAGLTMGALGPGVCAFALSPQSVEEAARIVVHLASPWERPSFEHLLPVGESVSALAVGREFLAVAVTLPSQTQPRLLRIHSLTGTSLGILSMAGDVVCLSASEDLLLCVLRAPGRQADEPLLDYCLYCVSGKELLASGRLPLSPGASLRWVGFSSETLPLAVDSAGAFRVLAASADRALTLGGDSSWIPVADLEENGARLWPVRAEGGILFCAEVPKGVANAEPQVGVVGRLRDVPFRLPFGGGVGMAGPEKCLRHRLFAGQLSFAAEAELLHHALVPKAKANAATQTAFVETSALKLFEVALKAGDLTKALDLVCLYPDFGAESQETRLRCLKTAKGLTSTASAKADGMEVRLETRIESLEKDMAAAAAAAAAATAAAAAAAAAAEPASESEDEEDDEQADAAAQGLRRPRDEASGAWAQEPPPARPRVC
eukprot:TRINITY_DN5513_c0_g1_i1.p1 TRINITY_DN5513_c0_g1~~TRINITY_DN5513_c0_g1_i1.p1  ORF type:complete len:968 (+),score=246.22 TRINITY_DN5513_c0_g1_i1:97-3000(+)